MRSEFSVLFWAVKYLGCLSSKQFKRELPETQKRFIIVVTHNYKPKEISFEVTKLQNSKSITVSIKDWKCQSLYNEMDVA